MSITEIERLSALRNAGVLDTLPEDRFDRLTSLAAALFDAPIALISLIDEDRQWFKSHVGLNATETPRAWAFCDHAIRQERHSVFIVEDATLDERFTHNPLVTGDPKVRFYAGATLTTAAGHNLGTLCVIDRAPRPTPSSFDVDRLKVLALMVVDQLEHSQARRAVAEQTRLLQLAEATSGVGHWRYNVKDGRLAWSDEVYRIHGVDRAKFDPNLDEGVAFYHPDDQAAVSAFVARGISHAEDFAFQLRLQRADGQLRNVICKATCEIDTTGGTTALFGVFQDVTDQMRTLQSVERSEARYRLLTENANDIVTEMDREGRFTYASPATTKVTGFAVDEIVGQIAMAFIHPDDHERVRATFETALKGPSGWRIEYRILCKDGRVIWVEARPTVARDPATGRMIAVTDVIRDITERKAVEEALVMSEGRYRRLADNASDIVTESDLEGRFTYVSPAAAAMTGYSDQEVIGRNALDFVHPEDVEQVSEEIRNALRAPSGKRIEHRHIRKDGQVIWVESRPTLVRDPLTNAPFAVTDVMRDITERKMAEKALAQSESRYRLLADNASDMISQFKPGGAITFMSAGSRNVLGYDPEEMIGRKAMDIIHPDDVKGVRAYYQAIRQSSGSLDEPLQFRGRHSDGHWVWLEGRPKMFFDAETGQPLETQDAVRDVTKRKELESDLRHARAEAEAAAAVKGEFLANMSHELRTPLTSILGFTKLLGEQEELGDQGRRYVERVSDASHALLTTVNDILNFSKLEAGQVEIAPRAVDPSEVVKSAVELLAPQADAKGLFQRLECSALPPLVMIDDTRIRQILLNFVSNAVKFTAVGGVTVNASYDSAAERLHLEVKDTGPGIPEHRLDRLFKRFSQVDASTTRSHGGTGLGLAICKGLAEAMGGAVGADSVLGEGSRFWVELPCAAVAPAPPVEFIKPPTFAAVDASKSLDGMRVLIADDNAINRQLISIILKPFGVTVTEAKGGAEAIQLAEATSFDIILMDIRMPSIDGLSAATAIRKGRGVNRATRIIAFTAEANDQKLPEAWTSIFDDQLPKPIIAADLINTFSAWHPKNCPRSESKSKHQAVSGA